MANRAAAAKPVDKADPKVLKFGLLFRDKRQIFWVSFFILFFCLDACILGLVAQQITLRGDVDQNWPGAEFEHTIQMLLFASIYGILITLGHYWLNLALLHFVFISTAGFFGAGAGLIYKQPIGRGTCTQAASDYGAPDQYFAGACSRWQAIEALSWVMFALSLIGFFVTLVDRYDFTVKRSAIYDIEDHDASEKEALNRRQSEAESAV